MPVDASLARGATALSEEQFYSPYAWCLNPRLSVRDLFDRLREELGRFEGLVLSWQQEESLVNLYLFVCAIGCSVADSSAGRTVGGWRRAWDRSADLVCDLLVAGPAAAAVRWAAVRAELEGRMKAPLPGKALGETMRRPGALGGQGLAHQDVIALARRLGRALSDRQAPVVIVGVRTAGAYFAPLVRAVLAAEGWARVSWITVRPGLGLSRWEARQLRHLRHGGARVALVDDHPDPGLTVRAMLERLARHDVRLDRITLAMPRPPASPAWTLPEGEGWVQGVRLVTLEPAELHKARLLEPSSMEALLREYRGGAADVRIEESGRVKAINAGLAARCGDGPEGRLKRVFELCSDGTDEAAAPRRVLVRSVGWGWLGYHAYLMGVRLAGCVPRLIGLRNGLLLTEWLDEGGACRMGDARDRLVDAIARYTARRAQQLALPGDPGVEPREDRRTGWDELVSILGGVYGPYVGRLKAPVVRRRLRSFVSPVPSVVDGHMRPEGWIETPAGIFKTDFDSSGEADLGIVDPAYDLAGAMCEFALPEPAARRLVEGYAGESGDRTITERLLLYELLYGVLTMRSSALAAGAEPRRERREEWNRRRLGARRFLVSRMNRLHAGLVGGSRARWSKRLFFLDLDGVFDCDALGFPHTTPSGVAALRLLRAHDVSVVLNTGRGVEDVREYCRAYGFAGGLAEFGSVFVDAAAGRELALIDAEAGEQLARCREELERHTGTCFDAGYRHSIRAYRYRNGRTAGLEAAEVGEVLARAGCERLDSILRPEDTYIKQRGTGKAPGVGAVRRYLGCQEEPVAAIGDSEYDVELLEMAERSYAPANCARSVRALGRRGRCRVMRQPYQRGLLAAVQDLVGETERRPAPSAPAESDRPAGGGGELVSLLLEAAERSTVRRWLGALSRRGL